MAESRVFISEQFFSFKGAGKKAGSSLYQCLNCPENLKKKNGAPMYYSCSDISRSNLREHLKSKHLGLLLSFDIACKEVPSAKRKLNDSSVETEDSKRQVSLQEAFSSPKPKKPRLHFFSQEEFDNYVVDYVVDSVMPLRHVDTNPFRTFMLRVAQGN